MHETYKPNLPADVFISPSLSGLAKIGKSRKTYGLFLPIGLEMFPYKKRTGNEFLFNLGYGGINDRRQAGKVVAAFKQLKDPDARLYIHSQAPLPTGVKVTDDKRIILVNRTYPEPKDIYVQGDISILPIAYGGYERGIPESMASGLPCLTMDADPMNLFQHDTDFLIDPCNTWLLSGGWVHETIYNEASVEDLKEKMEWLLTIDTVTYSERARRQAEAQSWECKDINYIGEWWKTLEEICS